MNLTVTPSHAFDAGTSDPNLRETDILHGARQCMTEVGFLQISSELTQLLLVTDRQGTNTEYFFFNGAYYYRSGGYSTTEANYTRTTSVNGLAVDGELFADLDDDSVATKCGWTSATFTNNIPSSNFASAGTSFADATSASVTLDYLFNGRNFSVTWAITGAASEFPTVTSIYTGEPNDPTSLSATAGNGEATISFTPPTDLSTFTQSGEEDNAITNYEYTLDNGSTWTALSPSDASSPVTVSGLVNGVTYSIKLRAVNGVGSGLESSEVPVTPVGPDTTAPTFDVAAAVGSVTSTGFTPSASIDEGGTIYYVVVADGATAPTAAQVKAGNNASGSSALATASAAVSSSPFDSSFAAITSLSASTAYDVYFVAEDDEATPNVQAAVTKVDTTTTAANSPALEFAEYEEEIRVTLVDDARRNLTSAMSVNKRLIRDARSRLVETLQASTRCTVDENLNDAGIDSELDTFECTPKSVSTRNNVPFDVDGSFTLSENGLSTSGSFFEHTGNYDGTQRRLFFGDFDVQRDGDTGSTAATLTARVAWEQITSDRTMLGYFIGAELAHSNIDGAFEGDQDRLGLNFGRYAVHQLADQLYFDGFLTFGAGRNNLDMANDVLALTSDYITRTATMGAALSGVYDYEQYEFRPELAFSYGKTWIGDVGFTGRAYGLADDTLSLDAGNVSIVNLTLRPEVVWALDAATVADSNSQLSFAPRLICERSTAITSTENCGGGAEISLSSRSRDGKSNAGFHVIVDKVGNRTSSSLAFNFEQQF